MRSCPLTIVEFLNARLDEDERASKAVPEGSRGRERALAEVAAKRKIVRGYAETHETSMRTVDLPATDRVGDPWSELLAWRMAVKCLAAVYANHSQYDASWEVPEVSRELTER